MKQVVFKKATYIIALLLFSSSLLLGNVKKDTILVDNLLEETYFFEGGRDNYLPLVDKVDFQGKTLHFKLQQDEHADLLLKIGSLQDLALFANSDLIKYISAEEVVTFSTDDLFRKYGQRLHFTVYNKSLSAKNLTVQLLAESGANGGTFLAQKEVVLLSQRKMESNFNNYLIIGAIIISILLATLNNYYPRVTSEFFRFTRAIAFREIDENLLKSRPFTWINILFYLFFSLLAAYLLICVIYLAPYTLVDTFNSTWGLLWLWVQVTGLILAWLIVKYSIVSNFTSLFNIKNFLPSHYFNYIRIGLFIFMAMAGVVLMSYLGFDITNPDYYKALFTILLISLCVRSVFLMFKLMNSASYKFLHLFLYLCATEVIPLGMILFLGFNQPF